MKIERVQAIYTEIMQYEIRLAPDPRSLGPLYLQNTIAECRNCLNAVSRIQLEVHREKQDVTRVLRAQEASYEVSFTEVLSTDERVRRLPSIEDRKATASVILRESLSNITALKAELQDLDFVDKAVRHRHKELTSTMSEVKLQRALIRDEMESGAMYGDERAGSHPRGSNGGPAGIEGIDEEALNGYLEMAKADAPLETPPARMLLPPSDVPESATLVVPDDASKVETFLGPDTLSPEDDFTSFLESF